MKLTVEFWTLNSEADFVKLGELRFDGEKITATSSALRNVLREPLTLRDGKAVSPAKDPEQFMRSLWRQYKSPYFTASKARRS